MNDDLKLFLSDMSEHGHYKAFLDVVGHNRPRLPRCRFTEDNVDEWKVKSGRQEGYDLLASLLGITFEE